MNHQATDYPDGLDPAVWQRLVDLRQQKLESEYEVKLKVCKEMIVALLQNHQYCGEYEVKLEVCKWINDQ